MNCYHGHPLSSFMIVSVLTIFSSLKSSALVSELKLKPHSKSTQQPNMNIIYLEASENALLKFSMKKKQYLKKANRPFYCRSNLFQLVLNYFWHFDGWLVVVPLARYSQQPALGALRQQCQIQLVSSLVTNNSATLSKGTLFESFRFPFENNF